MGRCICIPGSIPLVTTDADVDVNVAGFSLYTVYADQPGRHWRLRAVGIPYGDVS